jgi:alkylhydroperoxidase family enzyme
MLSLATSIKQSSPDEGIAERVDLRASQINGCGVRVDRH